MTRRRGFLAALVLSFLLLVPSASVHAASAPNPPAQKIQHPRGLIPRVERGQKDMPRTGATTAASTNPNCKNCNPPLKFTPGDPVVGGQSGSPGHVIIAPVYWAPAGYSFPASYKSVINSYLQDVALASSKNTNVYSVATQYYQQLSGSPIQHIQYSISAGAEVDDSAAFPAQNSGPGCLANAGFSACISDAGLQAELRNKLNSLGLPQDDAHVYMVMFPSGVETCQGSGAASSTNACSTNTYCAYHSSTSSPYILYSNQPYPDLAHCSDPYNGSQAPNGDAEADAQISLLSHEASESITDWYGAWMDAAGYEDGDECAYVYGTPLGSTGGSGTYYNQVIGNGKYYTQEEFSNEDYALGKGDVNHPGGTFVAGCVQQEELPTASFTAPSTVSAGASVAFDASASSDPDSASSPLTYSWAWGDGSANGSGVKPSHVFNAAGSDNVTLTVTESDGWSGSTSQVITVAAPGTPLVNNITPASGPMGGGSTVTINGSGFTGATLVSFGGTSATFAFISDRQLTATTPSHALGSVDVTISASAGTSPVSSADKYTFGLNGLYTLDAFGAMHPDDSQSLGAYPYWPAALARAAHPVPGSSSPQNGLVLDAWGGLHPYGGSLLQVGQEPYYPNLDVARDFVFLPNGTGGYELDGWGGIHPFSLGNNPLPPQPWQYPYFPGQDVAKKITLLPDASGGYVLDAFGGLHAWSVVGKSLPAAITQYGYWYGNNIARDIWLAPGSSAIGASGYVLDAFGGFHPFWNGGAAAPAPVAVYGYWWGQDIARGMYFMPGATTTTATGYTLDGFGGIHPFAVAGQPLAPTITQYGYWPGRDIAKTLCGN